MGFIYPNEAVVNWDLLIVIYPYITGLVAGAFIVSSLYHVFRITRLRPVSRFSLVTALSFLLAAPLPLVVHLGRPERALEMFLRPNLVSAMSGFGYIWMFYLVLVAFEIWLVFRPDIVSYQKSSKGLKKAIYTLLSLGSDDISEKSLALDRKLIKALALIGIPVACLLHGYVGFIFGAVKANAWWSTPLMPIIFLLSAIVSGIALLIVLYVVSTKLRRAKLDRDCLHSLAQWLFGFLVLALSIESLGLLSMAYESEESWGIIRQLLTQELPLTYFGLQFAIGSVLPILILSVAGLGKSETVKMALRFLAASFVLIGVFAMRWNVVVGGQLVSRSLRGIGSYQPPMTGEGGILTAAAIMLLPVVILIVIVRLIPPWQEEALPGQQRELRFSGFNAR